MHSKLLSLCFRARWKPYRLNSIEKPSIKVYDQSHILDFDWLNRPVTHWILTRELKSQWNFCIINYKVWDTDNAGSKLSGFNIETVRFTVFYRGLPWCNNCYKYATLGQTYQTVMTTNEPMQPQLLLSKPLIKTQTAHPNSAYPKTIPKSAIHISDSNGKSHHRNLQLGTIKVTNSNSSFRTAQTVQYRKITSNQAAFPRPGEYQPKCQRVQFEYYFWTRDHTIKLEEIISI